MIKKLENFPSYFSINEVPQQKGSVRVIEFGNNIGLGLLGTKRQLVDPIHFSDWVDETDTPFPTKQSLLDAIVIACMESNKAGISDAPADGDPYYRQNNGWLNDRARTLRVGVLGGQDVNTLAGLQLILDAIQLSLPNLTNDDFGYSLGDGLVVAEKNGFVKIDFKIVSDNQTNSRKNPTMILRLNAIDILESISYTYSRNSTDDLAQNTISSFIVPVVAGDQLSVFALRTGSAGAVLTVANESYISFKYVNNAR